MDSVIEQLTKIEEASSHLLSQVHQQKKLLEEDYKKQTIAFDEQLEDQTSTSLSQLKSDMTSQSTQFLESTLQQAKEYEAELSLYFEQHKKSLVQKIVQDILDSD